MSYCFAKTLDMPFAEATERTRKAIADNGFGILTEIDVSATLKKKIGAGVPPYLILGACNPTMAHHAMSVEPRIGVMLPCNVIVRETADGTVEVAGVDPVASMQAVDNAALGETAMQVQAMMKTIIESV